MGLETLAIISAAVGAVGTAHSIIAGSEQASQQKKAAAQAQDNAAKTAEQSQEQINRQNAQSPDTNAINSANQNAAKGGGGSTMLTGSQGVDPGSLSLGKTTLLGQ